jgi:hypothetical protein
VKRDRSLGRWLSSATIAVPHSRREAGSSRTAADRSSRGMSECRERWNVRPERAMAVICPYLLRSYAEACLKSLPVGR